MVKMTPVSFMTYLSYFISRLFLQQLMLFNSHLSVVNSSIRGNLVQSFLTFAHFPIFEIYLILFIYISHLIITKQFSQLIDKPKMNEEYLLPNDQHSKFREGMTLDQYLSNMKTIPKSQEIQDEKTEDLYETSHQAHHRLSKKIITYQIRESDEDNYDQSLEQRPRKIQPRNKFVQRPFIQDLARSNKNIVASVQKIGERASKDNAKDFRVRRQSNSPYRPTIKEAVNFSPNKVFSQTLHANNDWRIHKEPQSKAENSSATIYGKFIKGMKTKEGQHSKINQKQKLFKKKNTEQIEHLAKYEKQLFERYQRLQLPDLFNMRIEGIQDRLCERKILNAHRKTK